MKENRYDDPLFFEKYSQMSRSRLGLAGAGEWEDLQKLLPDFAGKQVLDLGCGYGWHCAYAAEHGAAHVTGVDLSEKMLGVARQKASFPQVEYLHAAIEDVDFPPESFDVVFSSLAIHYLQDFPAFAEKVRSLAQARRGLCDLGGASHLHCIRQPGLVLRPSRATSSTSPWTTTSTRGSARPCFLGEDVVKYHRTLTTYLDTLLTGGFALRRVVEAKPPERMLDIARHEGRAAPPHDAAGGRCEAVKEAAPWMATPR